MGVAGRNRCRSCGLLWLARIMTLWVAFSPAPTGQQWRRPVVSTPAGRRRRWRRWWSHLLLIKYAALVTAVGRRAGCVAGFGGADGGLNRADPARLYPADAGAVKRC